MLFLHQIHQLPVGGSPLFEAQVRDRWLPAVAEVAGARLAWYGMSSAAARWSDEAITITALEDPSALDRFATELRDGDLRSLAEEVAVTRVSVETRLMSPIDYDPWPFAFDQIPTEPQDGPQVAYMHDFVPPVRGQMRGYVDMMRERYLALSEKELSGVVLLASWQTVSGGGPLPEMFNLSVIRDVDALVQLVAHEIPRELKEMGSWMWEALAVRDRWTTRLLRSATWSPVR